MKSAIVGFELVKSLKSTPFGTNHPSDDQKEDGYFSIDVMRYSTDLMKH
jgi:hypothetical protein